MIYNLELVFEEAVQNKVVSYANKISQDLETDYILAENPHVRLIKFETENEITQEFKEELEVEFTGLRLVPSKDEKTWVEISVLQSEKIRETIKEFCSLFPNIKIISNIDDKFRPHITLSRVKNQNNINIKELNYKLLKSKFEAEVRLVVIKE